MMNLSIKNIIVGFLLIMLLILFTQDFDQLVAAYKEGQRLADEVYSCLN